MQNKIAKFVQYDEKKTTKLLEDKDSFNMKKATKASQTIFKASLQEKQIPEPATAEDLERFFENSTLNDVNDFDSENKDEGWSPEQCENSSDMAESDLAELSSQATAKSKSKKTSRKPGRKAVWRETEITDMVDIICSSEQLRGNLIFRNNSRSRNTAFYADVVKQLEERLASRGETFPFDVRQTRNKFKKCVAECKRAALTIRMATGIKCFQEEKNLGDWFSQLYSFVKTQDSCIPEMALEPSCSNRGESPETIDGTETGENSDSEEINAQDKNSSSKDGDTAAKAQFVPVRRGKKKVKVDPVVEAIETMKQVIEKDPTKDLLDFLRKRMKEPDNMK
ncbi:hypothetical protein ACROYT_G028538 [Oculina patagonica]